MDKPNIGAIPEDKPSTGDGNHELSLPNPNYSQSRGKKSCLPWILSGIIFLIMLFYVFLYKQEIKGVFFPTITYTSTSTATSTNTPTLTSTTTPTFTPDLGEGAGMTMPREADGMVMVYVPAGTFTMGSMTGDADERPVHQVFLDAYWIDQTEVTFSMYGLCFKAGRCAAPKAEGAASRAAYLTSPTFADYPVVDIDYYDASTYCRWAGARLPSEAEWEKSARGIDDRLFPWGDADPSCLYANFGGTSGCAGGMLPGGSFPTGASAFGVFDLSGNAWEWVADWYGPYPGDTVENPTGPASGTEKGLRSGSWNSLSDEIRLSNRGRSDPTISFGTIGFRCAMIPP